VAQPTLLTDALLRELMAVGQVDIVVGVPTLNNAGTIAPTMRAADEGLAKHFPRDRTVIIAADGGSRDGTPGIVQELASRTAGYGGLRTRHQIATSYRGPGKAGALRIIFAAADLLQAQAVALLDPEVTSVTPTWVPALADPVSKQQFDFVAPLYDRHPLEGPLLTQLVRPLIRATFRRPIDEPLIGEFGCSGRFAAHCLALDIWDAERGGDGIELWLTGTALAGGFQACQAYVGPRTLAPAPRPGLRELFPLVVGSLFDCLDRFAGQWLPRDRSEPLPTIGAEGRRAGEAPSLDPAQLGASFCQDVRDLRPVLESILAAKTFATLMALVESGNPAGLRYPDDLWIATVYDFLAARHAGVMDRAHITQALMPLYLGRAASFLMQHAASGPAEAAGALERISQEFELARPYLTEHWNRTS
jgi:hypothetical protein